MEYIGTYLIFPYNMVYAVLGQMWLAEYYQNGVVVFRGLMMYMHKAVIFNNSYLE